MGRVAATCQLEDWSHQFDQWDSRGRMREVALVLSALGLLNLTLAHRMVAKETLDLLPIEDLRSLLDQGEKVLDALSEDQKGQNVDNVGVNRKARDFLPSGSNSNTNTFKPSPSKALKDSFKPVLPIKSEKIVIDSNILIKPKQTSQTESSGLARSPPSSPPPTSAPPSTTSSPSTGSSELLATADPQLVGALGHASPEILAALQEAAPENLKVFLTFAGAENNS